MGVTWLGKSLSYSSMIFLARHLHFPWNFQPRLLTPDGVMPRVSYHLMSWSKYDLMIILLVTAYHPMFIHYIHDISMNILLPSDNLTLLWEITMFNGKTHNKWPIAMSNYQKVSLSSTGVMPSAPTDLLLGEISESLQQGRFRRLQHLNGRVRRKDWWNGRVKHKTHASYLYFVTWYPTSICIFIYIYT